MNRIAELKRARALHYKNMQTFLVEKDGDDGMTSDDVSEFDAMNAKLSSLDDRISRLEALNEREADEADDVASDDDDTEDKGRKSFSRSNVVIKHARPKNEPAGTRLARFVIGQAIAKNSGSIAAGQNFISKHFDDRDVVKALATTTQATGGAIVPPDYCAEIIGPNYALSVIRNLGVSVVPMPYGGMTYPVLTGSASTSWIGENQDIVVSQPSFGDLNLQAKKLAGIVPCSMELIDRSMPTVEQIVRENLNRDLALKEDIQMLTGTPSQYKPGSLLSNALPNQTHAITLTNLQSVNNMLTTMVLDLQAANISTAGAKWIFNPTFVAFLSTITDGTGRYFFRDEINQGTLFGYGYAISTQLATNLGTSGKDTMVMFVQPSELILADTMELVADSSTEASYVDGGSLVSAYSRWQMIFRVIECVDFAVKHPAAISVATVTGGYPSFVSNFNSGSEFAIGNTTSNGASARSVNPSGT